MKLVFKGIILVFLSFILIPCAVKAQDWEYGVSVGTSGYMGEYNLDNIFKFNSVSGSVGVKYNFNSTWGIKGNISLVGIKVGNEFLQQHNLDPKVLYEVSILPEFNFFKFEPDKAQSFFTPYVFAGVGLSRFEALNNSGGNGWVVRKAFPFGVGFKYHLKGNISADSQLSYRVIETDNLDAMGSLQKGNFMDRAASADSYMSFQIGITYTFFKQGCPTW